MIIKSTKSKLKILKLAPCGGSSSPLKIIPKVSQEETETETKTETEIIEIESEELPPQGSNFSIFNFDLIDFIIKL